MSGSGTYSPALVTKVEAARLLGVSRWTISRLVNSGVLQEVRLGEDMYPRLRRRDVLALAEGERHE